MSPLLCAQKPATRRLAKWWIAASSQEQANQTPSVEIEVREDVLFSNEKWLSLGQIAPRLPRFEGESGIDGEDWSREEHLSAALLKGGYEWTVPDADILERELIKVLVGKVNNKNEHLPTGRVRDAIAYALLRLGVEMPLLDARDLADLPFRQPVTLVADTNAVLQGGIDFSVRFLYPMARLRVPEPVHAELNFQAAQYLATRRGLKPDPDKGKVLGALQQRLTSQGGLRALLRVQLQGGVEIERLQVEAEEPRNYNLTPETKGALPDRMILETTLRHRALIGPGHPVRIMTSDQGLARSALIESISPLYFPPRRWKDLFGRSYIGAVFAPLPGVASSIWHRIPLTEILWELATCFGTARLRFADHSMFTVTATRRDFAWSPYHAREDLLWIESSLPGEVNGTLEATVVSSHESKSKEPDAVKSSTIVAPKLSAEKLLIFWSWMAAHRSGTLKQAAKALGVSDETARDYVRLMVSGGFLKIEEENIEINGELFDPLWTTLRGEDWDGVRDCLLKLPAFAGLCEEVSETSGVLPEKLRTIRPAALPSFQRLGEICGAILSVPETGLHFCGPRPSLDQFCGTAVTAYAEAITADPSAGPLVHSGAWLESLAVNHGIHPLFAPALLQEAITARRLDVVFEGSQPFRDKANHVFRKLVWRKDSPTLEEIPLYRGTYLAVDRASVHLKIELSKP